MLAEFVVTVFVILPIIVLILKPYVIVNEGEGVIVERMGRYHRILRPGLNFLVPFFEKLRCVSWKHQVEERGVRQWRVFSDYRIRTTETTCDILPMTCSTKDNVKVVVNVVGYYRIDDVKKAVYDIDDLFSTITNELETRIVSVVKKLDSASLNNETLEKAIITEKCDKWGVTITRCRIQEIRLPENISDATAESVREQRRCEVGLSTMKLLHEKEKLELEHRLMMTQLEHDAKLKRMKEEAEAMKASGLSEHYFISKELLQSTADKIFIPTNFANIIGADQILSHVSGRKDVNQ